MEELVLKSKPRRGLPVAARVPGPTRCLLRSTIGRWLTVLTLALACLECATPAVALDEIVLKNGRRYRGTILSSTAEMIVLEIEGGTVGFPRSTIVSPPYLGAPSTDAATPAVGTDTSPPPLDDAGSHPLPGVTSALRKLSAFPWASEIRQMPVLVTDQGRWQFTPCASFWVADFFQLNIHGDPARPAAIELSLHHPGPTAWEQKQKLLEYLLSLVPGLAIDNRFDRLDVNGDHFSIGDIWFEVTGPESAKSPGRWVVSLVHEISLKAARASYEELQTISELVSAATIDPQQPRSWQRGSWTPDELTWARQAPGAPRLETVVGGDPASPASALNGLGGHRIFVRAYARERERYVRVTADWTREFPTTGN